MPGISEQIALQEPRLAREVSVAEQGEVFSDLVRRQARFVFRVAYAVLHDVHDADDAVQETFLKLYRSRGWDRIRDEKAYLARVAWRIAVDLRARKPKSAPVVEAAWPGRNPEQDAIASDRDSVIHRLIDALPEELRQPLVLSGLQELSSTESARIMGISENAVRSRVMRARQILKQKLDALGAGKYDE
jgi:RNA polymerase sigma-70 factor (ECF subfamily)